MLLRGRRWLPLLAACLLLPSAPAGSAGNVFGSDDVVLAIVDSGVRPTHQEFDWSGNPADTSDQFVAWWDFTDAANRPLPGQTWDTLVPTPYDDRGHGTAIASLAVGLNRDLQNLKTRSFCPGCKIAVAKAINAAGTGNRADLVAAIRWAVDDVHADVISLALGVSIQGLPEPAAATPFDEAIEYARDRGVLVVAAAGNGPRELNQPGQPSWAYGPGYSTAALIVGGSTYSGSSTAGTRFAHDPEVTANGMSVVAADNAGDAAYLTRTGSSLSTALVAGMATRLLETSFDGGCDASAPYVESLLKFVAKDTVAPYPLEGFGFLSKDQFASANGTFAPSCTLPPRPALDLNRLYDESAAQALRSGFSRGLDVEGGSNWALTNQSDLSGPGVMGPSLPMGIQEIELWRLEARFGERVTVSASFSTNPGVAGTPNDFEIYLFRPGSEADGLLQGTELVAFSRELGRAPESFTIQFPDAGTYLLAVVGFSIVAAEAYDVSISSTMSDPSLILDRTLIAIGEHGII